MTDNHNPTEDRHTLSAFDEDLRGLRTLITEMGGLAEVSLENALTTLVRRDTQLASLIIDDDKRIDAIEAKVGQHIIGLIVRRAPMADDLREVLAAHRIAGMIERIGDYSKTIAKRVPQLTSTPPAELQTMLLDLGTGVRSMLKSALDAFGERDAAMASAVRERDREIDDLYNTLFLALLGTMMKPSADIATSAQLLFIAKSLERVGDQATNIAELVYFAVTGEQLPDRKTSPTP